MSLILITHDLRLAFSTCDRIYVLYAGSLLEVGDAAGVEGDPFHPYTLGPSALRAAGGQARAAARRDPRLGAARRTMSPTAAPSPTAATGHATICRAGKPPLARLAPGRFTACIRRREIAGEMRALRSARPRSRCRSDAAGDAARRRSSASQPGQDLRRPPRPPGSCAEGRFDRDRARRERRPRGRVRLGQDHARALPRRPRNADRRHIEIAGIDAADYRTLSRRSSGRELRRTVQMVFQDPYSTLNPRHRSAAASARGAARQDAPHRPAEVGHEPDQRQRPDVLCAHSPKHARRETRRTHRHRACRRLRRSCRRSTRCC